jgi:phosphotransferase system enzyme I (PtsP)
LNPGWIGQVRLDRSEGLVGWVGDRQELIDLKNAAIHPHGRSAPETGVAGYHTFLGVLLIGFRQLVSSARP